MKVIASAALASLLTFATFSSAAESAIKPVIFGILSHQYRGQGPSGLQRIFKADCQFANGMPDCVGVGIRRVHTTGGSSHAAT